MWLGATRGGRDAIFIFLEFCCLLNASGCDACDGTACEGSVLFAGHFCTVWLPLCQRETWAFFRNLTVALCVKKSVAFFLCYS